MTGKVASESAPPTGLTWLKCAGYFSNTAHTGDHWFGIRDGVIQTIQTTPPAGVTAVDMDLGSQFLVPLLADTHVHVYMEPWPLEAKQRTRPGSKDFDQEVEDAVGRVERALRKGIGFLRDMGDPHGINLAVRKHFANPAVPGPELQVPGTGIHRPKKYGRFLGVPKESVTDIKHAIDLLIDQHHVDFIKLVTTGIVDFEEKRVNQLPQYTQDELTEVVRHTHDRGMKVAAHCSGSDGLDLAIEAGVDFIEHAYFITEKQIERLLERQLVWTPTLVPVLVQGHHPECGWPEATRRKIDEILAQHNRQIERAHRTGALLLAGTDAGCPGVEMGDGLRTELSCLARSQIPPAELLALATVTNAQRCGARTYTGTLEPGSPASFGIYRDAPWEHIRHLNSLAGVYHHGALL